MATKKKPATKKAMPPWMQPNEGKAEQMMDKKMPKKPGKKK